MNLKNVAIVVEAAVAGASLLIALVGFVRSALTAKKGSSLRKLLAVVPVVVQLAEEVFPDCSSGSQKKLYALTELQKLAFTLNVDFESVKSLLNEQIEAVLAAPQKKESEL